MGFGVKQSVLLTCYTPLEKWASHQAGWQKMLNGTNTFGTDWDWWRAGRGGDGGEGAVCRRPTQQASSSSSKSSSSGPSSSAFLPAFVFLDSLFCHNINLMT